MNTQTIGINTQNIGLNMKSLKKIPFVGAVLMTAFFLPAVKISSEGISASGIKILLEAILKWETVNDGKTGIWLVALIAILGVSLISILTSSGLAFKLPTKKCTKYLIFTYVFNFVSALLILFTVTKAVNASGVIPVKFLIKYLSFGYWIFLIGSLTGLILSLRSAKINTGYVALIIMALIWLFPVAWIVMISFRAETGSYTSYFWPKTFTLDNYKVLLTDGSRFPFMTWFGNTLVVSTFSCIVTTFIVLSTAFTLSRIRFAGRKLFVNILLIIGMFPGFMSMIAVYYILKGLNLAQSLTALVVVYSGGAALLYYIAKGFFDTIPKAIDEAACIDGATKWQMFTQITIPISKPIIIYTILTSFMAPWADFIFARVIMGDNYKKYTVALGLFTMLSRENIDVWYTRFAAGSVLVSIPIAILFIAMQKYYVEGLAGSVKG